MWQLISSSLKPDTWLPHYYVFASTTQYWFDLSGYQPSEHLIKELTSVLKPNRRASKSKNSWWGTQQSVWESWHLNLRGAGHPGLMKRWVTKKTRWWRRQRDISAWVSLQLSSLCHPQFTELCPELKAQVLLLPQSQKLLPHPYLPAPQLSTTHQAALSAPHVALKWPELMRNICPLLLNSAQTHASDSFSLLSFVSAATITFFFFNVLSRGHYPTNCKEDIGFVYLKSSVSEVFQMSGSATISQQSEPLKIYDLLTSVSWRYRKTEKISHTQQQMPNT